MPSIATVAAAAAALAAAGVSAQAPATAECAGPIEITIDGKSVPWAVVRGQYGGTTANGASITLQHNDRAYIVQSCSGVTTFTPALYATQWQLAGKRLNYTVDLSTAGCACNVAFYAVSMPAVDANGNPQPMQNGDYYCDANDVGGAWCPEMDIMEANTAALQVTPHDCDAPNSNGYYPHCDGGGCGLNSYKNAGANAFGPGASYKVDTTQPFTVSTVWPLDPVTGNLTAITTTVFQAGRPPFVLSHTDATCKPGYLAALTPALKKGMVPALSVWGSDGKTMEWLDVPPCALSQQCPNAGVSATFTGISLTTL